MAEPIRFYFDLLSTYSYFAVERLPALAARHGREVDWRLVSLPHVLKANGTTPPPLQPRKLAHNVQDVARLSAMLGIPFKLPRARPPDVSLARLMFYRLKRTDPRQAAPFATEMMRTLFGKGSTVATIEEISRASASLGISEAEIEQAAHDAAAKADLHAMLDVALADGMFGAPFAVVDDQMFWGHDRVIEHLDWWLTIHTRGRKQ